MRLLAGPSLGASVAWAELLRSLDQMIQIEVNQFN
jgi:hypothetical protein